MLIGIYAIGYMEGYHKHHLIYVDRRNYFFAVIFIFYGAMFGLVSSMNIMWMDFFWEVTSVCSFLLIGYTRTKEAIDNSFRALWMNLLGGLGLAVAIVFAVLKEHTVSVQAITDMAAGSSDKILLIPIAMLAFAALTKSAQMPFSQWLLGAMHRRSLQGLLQHQRRSRYRDPGGYIRSGVRGQTRGHYRRSIESSGFVPGKERGIQQAFKEGEGKWMSTDAIIP